jgi:hemerythrin superfamily protein
LKRYQSEEKLAFNDFVEFSRRDSEIVKQGKQDIESKGITLKHKLHDILNSNMLDERDPDLYQTIITYKHRKELQKKQTLNMHGF